ncbi:MAG: PASTA domain-containing protein [Bacteroidaceae bacterium]|nr:PASTA domain-containing protein [Bacteroidaceae bacterium]
MRFKGGAIVVNIIFMLVMLLLLLVGLNYAMNIYTRHGETIIVPSLNGMNVNEAQELLEEQGLKLIVSDSVYNKRLSDGQIVGQSPKSGLLVKSGHEIFITVNSQTAASVQIPDIIDNSSYRDAEAELMALGFKMGEPIMMHGEKDWVYGIVCGGHNVYTGDFVPLDSKLQLKVGDGVLDGSVDVVSLEEDVVEQTEDEGEFDDFEEVK